MHFYDVLHVDLKKSLNLKSEMIVKVYEKAVNLGIKEDIIKQEHVISVENIPPAQETIIQN